MKKTVLFLMLILCALQSFSQRYLTNVFTELDSTINGTYGNALDYLGANQNLQFDFYEPKNDTETERPLLIYLHGGGFTSGDKDLLSVKLICRKMALKGYAVANINYRLDPNFDMYNSATDRRAMTDAMHDAKQAIRYFKANATTYKIDVDKVFIGGESAGAITSMMASFVDKQSEMVSYPMAIPNNVVGSTANNTVDNTVAGALCLCGLLLDTNAIETPSDPDVLWTHGSADSFIPIALSFNVVLRALHIGLPIQTKVYNGADHCPWYYGSPNWDMYLDSTLTDISTFLYPRVTTNGVEETQIKSLKIYPNPFNNVISIHFDDFIDEK